MVSADAHSPVLGVSFATDNDDDFDETVVCFSLLCCIGFPGGRKRHHHSPRVRRRRRRAGGDTDTEYECSSCGVLVSWYDEKQEARGGVCVRACVRLRGYFKCGGRFLSKKNHLSDFLTTKKPRHFF